MVRRDGTLAEGVPVMCSDTVAGAVEQFSTSIAGTVTVDGNPQTDVPLTITNNGRTPIGFAVSYSATFTSMAAVMFNLP